MCFIADLRDYGPPKDAQALFEAAVLASRSEAAKHRPEFTGMVMLHAAQYFAERMAETIAEDPGACLLALLQSCGVDQGEVDAKLMGRVVSRDAEAGLFFEQRLKNEAAQLITDNCAAARLAAACIMIARIMFADFAVQAGASADKGSDLCAGAAYPRMLRYEVVH